jgi:hypothetical protein
MIDSNQNITRKFDLNMKKIKLKIDFDSSLTCYSLDPKSNNFIILSNLFQLIKYDARNG